MDHIEIMAAACHEMNRLLCIANGDETQVHWEQASETIRESARSGVKFYLARRCTPEQQHAEWRRFKEEQGYVYGAVKDDAAKTHPCIVEYNELPEFQRRKDTVFQSTVNTMEQVLLS